jgi:hypothetical protein
LLGLVLIVAGARDIYLLHIEETFDVTLSDYETPIRTIAGAMIGLAQALRLLLEISAALRACGLDSSVNSSVILSRLDKLAPLMVPVAVAALLIGVTLLTPL